MAEFVILLCFNNRELNIIIKITRIDDNIKLKKIFSFLDLLIAVISRIDLISEMFEKVYIPAKIIDKVMLTKLDRVLKSMQLDIDLTLSNKNNLIMIKIKKLINK